MFSSLVSLLFGGEKKQSAPEPVNFDDDAVNVDSTSSLGNNEEEKENVPEVIEFETNEEDDWLLVNVSSETDDSPSEDDMCLSRLTESQSEDDMCLSRLTESQYGAMSIIEESVIPTNVANKLSPEVQTTIQVDESLSEREDMSFNRSTESLITSMRSLSKSTEFQTSCESIETNCESIAEEALLLERFIQKVSPKVKKIVEVFKSESEKEMRRIRSAKCHSECLQNMEELREIQEINLLKNTPWARIIYSEDRLQPRKKVAPNTFSDCHPTTADEAFLQRLKNKLYPPQELSPLAKTILGKSQSEAEEWFMQWAISDVDSFCFEALKENENIRARYRRKAMADRIIDEMVASGEPFGFKKTFPRYIKINKTTLGMNGDDSDFPLRFLISRCLSDGDLVEFIENEPTTGKSEKNDVLMDKANLSTCPLHKCSGTLSSGVSFSSRNDKARSSPRSLYIQSYLAQRHNQAGSESSPKCFARYRKKRQQKLCSCQPSILTAEKVELPETFESHQPALPSKADLLDHIKSLKPQQKIKDMNIRKLLAPSQMDRQNRVKLYEGKAKNNRRKDLWRCHSGANNNRKCC